MAYIKNIIIFMIFTEVLLNIVPNNDYRRYIRLYMGIIVIILVLKPLNGIFNMDYIIDSLYVKYDYKNETDSLKNKLDILKGDDGIYLEAAKQGIGKIVEAEGFTLAGCVFLSESSNKDGAKKYYGVDIDAITSDALRNTGKRGVSVEDIKVDRIIMGTGGRDRENSDITDENMSARIASIKNSIREVYNFDINNINVSIRG